VSLTAGLDTLQRLAGAPAAELDWAGPVSAETLRRIACDALLRLIPPPWIDPDQTPRRNTYWRIRDHLPPPDGP
jgi:hypothetical protein